MKDHVQLSPLAAPIKGFCGKARRDSTSFTDGVLELRGQVVNFLTSWKNSSRAFLGNEFEGATSFLHRSLAFRLPFSFLIIARKASQA